MNTMEINNIAVQAEAIKPMTFERATQRSATTPPQPVLNLKCEALVHYAILLVLVLSLGCLGFYVQNSINQINLELQQIHANLVTSGSL
jgi:hypothetical protein